MLLPNGTLVAVADGEKLKLFRNKGDEQNVELTAVSVGDVDTDNKSGGARHQSSAANPDASQVEEDGFAAGVADLLNRQVLQNKADNVVVIAAPRTLGELRKHYHQKLETALLKEVAKDLTGHSVQDIEKALLAA